MIKLLTLNPFQVNTYFVHDEQGQCVIIDPACYEENEKQKVVEFVKAEGLKPVLVLNTHCHIDHILGNNFITKEYNIPLKAHKDSIIFLKTIKDYANAFGFEVDDQVLPVSYLAEGDQVGFGGEKLEVIHTPGHADGSLCFYSNDKRFLICGDVLFKGGIGRTDLPTGDYDMLIKNIKEKLLVLPEDVVVYSGHGPETTIGEEKRSNPFLV